MTGTVYSGEKIDMWSVGIILYIMVTGCAPFQVRASRCSVIAFEVMIDDRETVQKSCCKISKRFRCFVF